jgi:hypothetical protein
MDHMRRTLCAAAANRKRLQTGLARSETRFDKLQRKRLLTLWGQNMPLVIWRG